jgi:regulator of sigma E protease
MFCLVISTPTLGSTTVGGFFENSVSDAKLQINDEIVKIGNVRVHTGEEVYYEVMMQGFEAIDITVKRNGETVVLENVVFNTVEDSGVILGDMDFKLYALSALEDVSFFDYLYQAFYRSLNMVKMVVDSLVGMISGRFGVEAVSGPIGIVETVGEVAQVSVSALVNLIVLISMNLGIFNLLPIPALDGGRIIFHLIDGIAGRKVIKKETEDAITGITLLILLGLMMLISVKDVINLF